ncbi:cell division protein FtsA [Capnocytophaga sp.]|uniref:cell division protein FtsA n=1 Tax=Capnocytophaga sp. TaxID=44737 RepID=UPI0026DD1A35|nr:cell division protein FtsA [Capnocytophaga sp.]MDO5104279.1 cell division protein FtsA [Capnocytophaga sp.]
MKHKKYYVGLDIGTTKIVAMVGAKNEYGKIQILGYGQAKSEGINKGVVHNITKTTQSILEAIRDAEEKTGLQIKNVVVGIAGQHILSRSHSDYIIRPYTEKLIDLEDLEQLKQQVYRIGLTPGQKIIHALPQEYKVDDQGDIREPIGMIGSRLDASFHLVIGQVNSIKSITRCVELSGLSFTGLTLEPLASASSVLSDEEKDVGVALVDIGGGTTDVAIFKDGIIRHTAVIPMGGNIITEDIKEGCAILGRQAEMLKVEFGSAWPGENRDNEIVSIPGIKGKEPKEITLKNLSKIIHARVSEIITLVFNTIKSYGHEEHKKKLIAGIVLTGGGSQLKHIVQLVEYITGMDTRIGYPNEHLASNSDVKVTSPIYATSIGLVMSAIDYEAEETIRQKMEVFKENLKTEESRNDSPPEQENTQPETKEKPKTSRSFWERVNNRIKEFLDSSDE